MRAAAGWRDVCILNISSRGLMVRSLDPLAPGDTVELSRADQVVTATVVWKTGSCVGLMAAERLSVPDLLSGEDGCTAATQMTTCGSGAAAKMRRTGVDSRIRARLLQFAGTAGIAALLAGGAALVAERALARPLAAVSAALAR